VKIKQEVGIRGTGGRKGKGKKREE